MTTYKPEKLSLWDRWFNRTKRIPVEQGQERWINTYWNNHYMRDYVIYHNVDRLTGSYTIIKDFLD